MRPPAHRSAPLRASSCRGSPPLGCCGLRVSGCTRGRARGAPVALRRVPLSVRSAGETSASSAGSDPEPLRHFLETAAAVHPASRRDTDAGGSAAAMEVVSEGVGADAFSPFAFTADQLDPIRPKALQQRVQIREPLLGSRELLEVGDDCAHCRQANPAPSRLRSGRLVKRAWRHPRRVTRYG